MKRRQERETSHPSLSLHVTLLLYFLFAVGHIADLPPIHQGGVTPSTLASVLMFSTA